MIRCGWSFRRQRPMIPPSTATRAVTSRSASSIACDGTTGTPVGRVSYVRSSLPGRVAFLLGSALVCEPAVRAASPPDIFVVAQSLDDLVSLDPGEGFELSSLQAFTALYQRLIQPDRDQPSLIRPVLAASWTAGARSLTFELRPGAVFSGGNPL